MELEFTITAGPGAYDQTYGYNVTFKNPEKVYTVRDLLQHILEQRKGDWGSFHLNECSRVKKKNCVCEYKHGEMLNFNQELFDKYADRPIRAIRAFGGYSHMNYQVCTKDERLILAYEREEDLEERLSVEKDRTRGLSQMVREKDAEIKALKNTVTSAADNPAAEKLAKRVEWLAWILRAVALGLLIAGIFLPAVGTWLWETNFGYACFSLMGMGLLFALGYAYLRSTLREYERNQSADQEESA